MSNLLRSNLVVATGTALSRLSGLARVVALGAVLGQTALADAYRIGNETPNAVYELLLGGVLSATLIPLFTTFDQHQDDESRNVVITTTLVALGVLTVVAVVAAPLIFHLYTLAPGGDVDAEEFRRVGTLLTRIFLIQIVFYGLTALANAFLNARRRFFAAAWSPILPNVIIVVTLLSLPAPGPDGWTLDDALSDDRLRWTLGLGATLGIAAMALVLVPAMYRAGLRWRPTLKLRHPAVKQLATLSGWTLGYVVANQVVVVIVRNLTEPGSGDATAYFDAYTFFVLPHGLLAMSIAITFTPELASAVARRDRASFTRQASLGVRLIGLLTIPAAAFLFVLRQPTIALFLERRQYSAADALNTSRALGGFALGLVGFSVYLFTLRGFYAHTDTRTPFFINLGQCVLNVVLALAVVERYGVLGLAGAFAASYLLAAVFALWVLRNKVPGFPLRDTLHSLGRMTFAGLLAAETMWVVGRLVGSDAGLGALLQLTVAGTLGVLVYIGVLLALRAPELSSLSQHLPGRRTAGVQ